MAPRDLPVIKDKNFVPSAGVLITAVIIASSIFVAGFTLSRRSDHEIKRVVAETMGQHKEKSIKRAHPDIGEEFVPRTEVQDKLHTIERTQDKMSDTLQRIRDDQQRIMRTIRVRRVR